MGSDVQGSNLGAYVVNTQGLIPNPWGGGEGGGRVVQYFVVQGRNRSSLWPRLG